MHKKLISSLFVLATLVFFLPQFVLAQSCPNEETLLTCAHMAVESCREDVGCEGDRRQAMTKQDIVENAADVCCSKSTLKKRKRCLRRYRRRMRRGLKRLPVGLRGFMREGVQGVRTLSDEECDTGSLDT